MQIDRHDIQGLTFSDGLVVSGEVILHLEITEGEMVYNERDDRWIEGHQMTVVYMDAEGTVRIRKDFLKYIKCEKR